MPNKSIEKVVWSQDSYYKKERKNSGETSLNLSNDIFELLGGVDNPQMEFVIYKEDFLKALGVLVNKLPLYTTTSKGSTLCNYSNYLFESYYEMIQTKFGLNEKASYIVHMFKRDDGRIYLKNLKDDSGFNIRQFLIQAHSKLIFIKNIDDIYELRLISYINEYTKDFSYQSYKPIEDYKLEQKIYFGTPGSGKSWTIKKQYEQDETKVFRTTFHPDTDYASFVGCYKPVPYEEDDEKKITYKFVPQAFTDAYVAAWNDLEHPYYLIIEEINRGNCAQIFGDLFQLLDRKKDGYSEYPIKADHDLRDYLVEHLPEGSEGIMNDKLCLPPNLSIIASMNTSDQSLFPMDSAFKRRWSWEYVPIDYENAESGKFEIIIGGEPHNWHEFLKAVNGKIKKVTSSEDKQMGNFFIKDSVDEKEFCDKVMFYLWSEVGKDNYQTNDAIFRYYAEEDKLVEFSFNELYDLSKRSTILKGFIRYIEEEK
ncbi:MAG: AAA family ATPase [Prevotella sp.]|nr:AAA family ATPase [Prevotella sp.]